MKKVNVWFMKVCFTSSHHLLFDFNSGDGGGCLNLLGVSHLAKQVWGSGQIGAVDKQTGKVDIFTTIHL